MRDQGIADRIRAKGVTVVEIDGWRTRGSDTFDPRGAVDHHTAGPGPQHGPIPSLGVLINGRAGLAGPLCNVGMGRDLVAYVIAAGRANHAGIGWWRGLSGNSSVYGLERENVGTPAEPWTEAQHDTASRILAAMIEGRATEHMVCEHKEWTSRKIDCHTVPGDHIRSLVAGYLGHSAPPEDDHMSAEDVAALKEIMKDWEEDTRIILGGKLDAVLVKLKEAENIPEWKNARLIVGTLVPQVAAGLIKAEDIPHEIREHAAKLNEKYPDEGFDLLTLNPDD